MNQDTSSLLESPILEVGACENLDDYIPSGSSDSSDNEDSSSHGHLNLANANNSRKSEILTESWM